MAASKGPSRKIDKFDARSYGGFTIMEKLVIVSGSDGNRNLLFQLNLTNQTRKEIEVPCQHLVYPLSLKVAMKEHLVLSCKTCKNIKIAPISSLKDDEKTPADFQIALEKEAVGKMCEGGKNYFYAEHVDTHEILELDCSTPSFSIRQRVDIGVKHPDGLCYMPSPLNMLVVSDHQGRKVQAVSCESQKIVWSLSGSVEGRKIYPHGSLYSASYADRASVLIADGEKSRVLVLEAESGSHLQTIGTSDNTWPKMCVMFDLSFYQEQNPDTKWLVVSHRDYPGYVDENSEKNLPVQLTWLELSKLRPEMVYLDNIEQISSYNIDLQRVYGFTVMRDTAKVVVSGKRESTRALFLFSPRRGGSLHERTINYPCKHGTDDILCVQIEGKEWLCMTCIECQKIRLMDVEHGDSTSVVAMEGMRFFIMCKGEQNRLYVALYRCDQVLELDCSTPNFTVVKSLKTRTDRPYDICYVSSRKGLVVSDIHRRELKFISSNNDEVEWAHNENDRNVKIDAGSMTFSSRYDRLLVSDYDNPKILIHDPKENTVTPKQIRDVPNMGSIRFMLMFDSKIIILYELCSSYTVAYFSMKEKKESVT